MHDRNMIDMCTRGGSLLSQYQLHFNHISPEMHGMHL